jgi:hypothetical protein
MAVSGCSTVVLRRVEAPGHVRLQAFQLLFEDDVQIRVGKPRPFNRFSFR